MTSCIANGGCGPHGSAPWLALLAPFSFPQTVHVPGFFSALGSPLYFELHCLMDSLFRVSQSQDQGANWTVLFAYCSASSFKLI